MRWRVDYYAPTRTIAPGKRGWDYHRKDVNHHQYFSDQPSAQRFAQAVVESGPAHYSFITEENNVTAIRA
jgi:hypothetical protein